MSDSRDPGRNPLVIPEKEPRKRRGCPKCGGLSFGGQMAGGVAVFKCRDCQNEWQGGIGQEPQDPRIPVPPQDPRSAPVIGWEKPSKQVVEDRGIRDPNQPVDVVVRRPDPTPDFRKGALIPSPGDEDV